MTPDGHSWKPRRVVTLESESRWSLYLWCRSRARHVVVMKGRLKLRCSLQLCRESVRETRVEWKWPAHDLMSRKRIQEDGERLFLMVVNKYAYTTYGDTSILAVIWWYMTSLRHMTHEISKHENTKTRKHENTKTWKHENMKTWKHVNYNATLA